MTLPAYPPSLRAALRASKSRMQPAAFRVSEPRRGFAYAQATGTDTPVMWDVQFRFTTPEAIQFQLWFVRVLQRGVREFTMPIGTEFGLLEHTCRFLPDGLLDHTEEGGLHTYSAKILARAQLIPQEFGDAGELIAGLPGWDEWAVLLDSSMAAMPQA